MQLKVFTVPVIGSEEAIEEVNRHLRGCRAVSVDKQLCQQDGAWYWTFCVTEADGKGPKPSGSERREKVDYREVLEAPQFAVFDRLRKVRKQMAEEQALPAYAIFTDAELAEIARLENLSEKALSGIDGIGDKRVEKFGHEIIARYNTLEQKA